MSGNRAANATQATLPQTGESSLRINLVFFLVASICFANPNLNGQDTPAPGKGHRFACTDYSQGKVFIFSADGQVEWEYPAGDELCYGLAVLPNGNLLYTSGSYVKEVTRDKKVVFSYQRSKPAHYPIGFSACQRLPNGNTLIADGAALKLLEVDPRGQIAKEVTLPKGKEAGGIRGVGQLNNGNYLVCHYRSSGCVCEYDPQGKALREIAVPGGATCAVRLPNGNTLISYKGSPAGVFEVDAEGKTVWNCSKIKGSGLPTGLERLPNGNTVIAYWHGGDGKDRLHVVEVTPESNVVWSFTDPLGVVKGLGIVRLLDEPGGATKEDSKSKPRRSRSNGCP
jgi:hypothetical protein